MRYLFLTICIFCSLLNLTQAQQTIGTIALEDDANEGYTLISPIGGSITYLIDNCGQIINSWQSDYNAGLAAYLSEDGMLTRAGKFTSNSFTIGGSGGLIEQYDWEGNLIWQYFHSSANTLQHHDIHVLDNGNILFLAVEPKLITEAIENGRNPDNIGNNGLYDDVVYEIDPSTNNIVWKWSMWDHMIQDFDITKSNYGVLADNPHKVDINHDNNPSPDFIHFNSIDYDPILDQILLSSNSIGEIFIIDHSTTTAEAAGSIGGNANMGGDILFRWGDPSIYDKGTAIDKFFYGQHSARFIKSGIDSNKIMVFNNGSGRPSTDTYSTIEIIDLIRNGYHYQKDNTGRFLPNSQDWIYSADRQFYSARMSSCVRLENEHTIICYANIGQVIEINAQDEIVWSYIVPLRNGMPLDQGSNAVSNDIFNTIKYPTDYLNASINIEIGPTIEQMQDQSFCLLSNTETIKSSESNFLYPNPFEDILYSKEPMQSISISSILTGNWRKINEKNLYSINLSNLASGIYLIKYENTVGDEYIQKLIKN